MRWLLLALLAGCGGSSSSDCTSVGAESVPSERGALFEYLDCGGYDPLAKESVVHPADAAHGAQARVFINALLAASLTAGAAEHPVGAASIKELYREDGTTLRGWAAMVKVEASGGGDAWYWYEANSLSGGSPIEGKGNRTCTGCHSLSGSDYFRTSFPLR